MTMRDKIIKKLKLCPFCGREATCVQETTFGGKIILYFVECDDCGARSDRFMEQSDAIKVWNRRVSDGENM